MLVAPPASPLRYSPAVEKEEAGEEEIGQELIDTMQRISETTYKDHGHADRSVHAKSHGLVQGELEVTHGEYAVLAQGLFAKPGRYPVVMRFSTLPGDMLDDDVSTPRGLAIKVYGVEGERLAGSENDTTQDFVLVNGPAFAAPNGKAFLANLKLLAATTDKAEGLKKAVSAALQPIEKALEDAGHPSATLAALGGQPETNVLGETYYSQVPLRYGDYVAKISVAPVSEALMALHGARVDLNDHPNGLREAVVDFFATHGGEWELRVQLCTNLEDMPVENAAKVWTEDESPYFPVARIRVEPQTAWSKARSEVVDDGMAFSPWHGLAAHRPLGSVMRLRRRAYEMSSHFRAEHNQKATGEPTLFRPLPD
jgi:hypothetical protein